MGEYWICRRDNPHFRLDKAGRDFNATAAPMVFATYEQAFDYTAQNNTEVPLHGAAVVIVKGDEP